MRKAWAILILSTLVLTGCGTVATPPLTTEDATALPQKSEHPIAESEQSTAPNVVQSDAELASQRLEPGECGLFLWNRNNKNQFIFFSKAGAENALLMFNDVERNLIQTGVGGEIFGQFLTEMSYRDVGSELIVAVTIEAGERIEGGQKVNVGKILITDSAGWEIILPIAGTRVCL